MAKSLKINGIADLEGVKRRTDRQLTLKRITPRTHERLIRKINELISFIVEMDEDSPDITKESFG